MCVCILCISSEHHVVHFFYSLVKGQSNVYLINPYVYILLALIMTSQYVCAVLVLCQCAPVSTHTGLLHSQSGDTHAVAEVTCANEVFLI